MKNNVTPELLHKYIDGQCTEAEILMLDDWYDWFEDLEDPLENMSETEQQALKLMMLERFKASINVPLDEEYTELQPRKFISAKLIYMLSGIAALLLIFLAINIKNKKQADTASNSIITTASELMLVENQTGSIYKQILPDKSIVWMSPKSKLQFPKKFIGALRQVKMTGEAFFEVTKDHAHPFVIDGGGVITRVWGTSFRIRSVMGQQTEVSVETGKVSVKIPEKDQTEVMLYPQEKAIYKFTGGVLSKEKENARSGMRIWARVSETFDNVPLDDVLATLRNHYGMQIYTNDKELGKYLLKADFTDQNLPAILDMLENSLNAAYTIDDTQIVLYRKTN